MVVSGVSTLDSVLTCCSKSIAMESQPNRHPQCHSSETQDPKYVLLSILNYPKRVLRSIALYGCSRVSRRTPVLLVSSSSFSSPRSSSSDFPVSSSPSSSASSPPNLPPVAAATILVGENILLGGLKCNISTLMFSETFVKKLATLQGSHKSKLPLTYRSGCNTPRHMSPK